MEVVVEGQVAGLGEGPVYPDPGLLPEDDAECGDRWSARFVGWLDEVEVRVS